MSKTTIVNGNIIFYDEIIKKNLIIENGKISGFTDDIPHGADIINAQGLFVSPGFIDIHTHGAGGVDAMMGTYDAINGFSKELVKHGVTSFLPTTMTAPVYDIQKAIANVKEAMKKGTDGSLILGVHLEGPFISKEFKGAQCEDYILSPSIDSFKNLVGNNQDIVRNITIAPELNGATVLSEYLAQNNINVSLGHTNADYNTVKEAVSYGFSHATHTFNGMRGFHHREPGTVGAVMDISDLTAEIIADGIHSTYPSIRILAKCKGPEKLILITDSMMATGLKDGIYSLGPQSVIVKHGQARLKDGTLAGSTLTLNKAIKNVVTHCKIHLTDAIRMASYNPAKKINVSHIKGLLKQGYDADITLFDSNYEIYYSIINGKIVYKR